MAIATHETNASTEVAADDLLLEVRDLRTWFSLDEGTVKALDGATFDVKRGKTLCIVGESGCGKSMTARSILQIVQPPGKVVDGEMLFHRTDPVTGARSTVDLASVDSKGSLIRSIRGKEISMIFQEPMTSFSMVHTIGNQIAENVRLHSTMSKEEARLHSIAMLRKVGIPRSEDRFDSFAYQLSGGLRQRAMIAMALSNDPALLIADEPTTALDVTTQAQILELMKGLQDELGMAMIFITHDLGVVAEIADEVAVMYLGMVVERGTVDEIFHEPKHPYTRALLQSIPRLGQGTRERLSSIRGMVPDPYDRPPGCPFNTRCDFAIPGVCDQILPPVTELGQRRDVRCLLYEPDYRESEQASRIDQPVELGEQGIATAAESERVRPGNASMPLLDVEKLQVHYPIGGGFLKGPGKRLKAVDQVTFSIRRGETLGLVGESGCGKTTTGRSIVRAIEPTGGAINYHGESGGSVNLGALGERQLKPYRRDIRMVFQDPFSSLNPRMTVQQTVGEPLQSFKLASGREKERRISDSLNMVGLRPEYMRRYPHAFSGGERQRISIARALVVNPRLVVLDEAVSALDVSVRAQILNLLHDLQQELDLTYLFISHDLSVIEHICDRVAVMYVGKIIELAPTARLFATPHHPYTEVLMSAVPIPDPRLRNRRQRIKPQGEVADPVNPPSGCYFHPRCQYAQDRCKTEEPLLRQISPDHFAACHFSEDLNLLGVRQLTASAPVETE
jgi:peptide/nickel transport system ATP-binding protein